MWMQTNNNTFDVEYKKDIKFEPNEINEYSEEDDTSTYTGRTLSTVDNTTATITYNDFIPNNTKSFDSFESLMKDSNKVSKYQTTYFMDGGNRFISLPTLGNTSTKAASHISRIFEDWLQNKLYNQNTVLNDRLPILEDSVELLAEDILNKLKSRNSIKGLIGLSRILIKIKTGHVYTLQDDMLTIDLEDFFFQQFPLFMEIVIYTMPKDAMDLDDVQLLLSLENITVNPNDPYHIKDDLQLIV